MGRLLFFAVFLAAALARAEQKFSAPPSDLGAASPGLQVRPLVDTQVEHAAALFEQKNYPEALPAYLAALPSLQDARRQEALFRIAESYRFLHRLDEAAAVYKMLAESSMGSLFVPIADYQRAQIFYGKGEWSAALELFNAALAANPDLETKEASRFFAASCQLKLKQGTAGLQAFADKNPPGPYSAAAAQMLAEFDEKASDWAGAAKNWEAAYHAAQEKPLRSQAAARAALAFLKSDHAVEAERFFQASRAADPYGDYAQVSNTGLLDLYFHQKRYQDVIDFFNANREKFLDASRGPILLEVARSEAGLKDWLRAVEYFDLYLAEFKTSPETSEASYERLLARAQIDPENILGDTAAFLAAYPKAPQLLPVLFLRAQQYSARKEFAQAAPIWDQLVKEAPDTLPAPEICFEHARAHAALGEWKIAADGFTHFIEKFPKHPSFLAARQGQAVALQNVPDPAAAEAAWEEVLKLVPPKSPDAQAAVEQEAVLDGRLNRHAAFIAALQTIHRDFPQSHLWPMATYTLGAEAFTGHYYDDAEPLLREARAADPKDWNTAALYRLIWIAYQKKDAPRGSDLVKEYDGLDDPQAQNIRVPAAIYYWLGTSATAAHQDAEAASWFAKVTVHPEGGKYLTSAWWELAGAQRRAGQYAQAVESYETFRARDPKAACSPQVLLDLAEAQTGAGLFSLAKEHLDQVLLAEPEGKINAQARFLIGQWYFAQSEYGDAIKSFATLSLIYRDNDLTPRALARAAEAADKMGDAAQAESWRKKLHADYPAFTGAGE